MPVVNRDGTPCSPPAGKTLTVDEVQKCESRYAGKVMTFPAH